MTEREPRVPLEILDPGFGDVKYWERFHRRVMSEARVRLAARRQASLTMGDIVVSWGRMILPLAAAAALSVLLLAPRDAVRPDQEIAGVEEVLELPASGEEPLPSFLHSNELVDRDVVLFAVEGF